MKVINGSNFYSINIGDIIVSIAICYKGTQDIIEIVDSVSEAKSFVKEENYNGLVDYWYLAAETINEDGDTNPAFWGKSRNEAISRLKRVLK